ncbi:hypothetical protein MJO29_003143 [Puccinia striiformis f. sp. tritici]|nr:hypothetical protein MJO29_003143 [Puccinia striiformis f. sp. tritici]
MMRRKHPDGAGTRSFGGSNTRNSSAQAFANEINPDLFNEQMTIALQVLDERLRNLYDAMAQREVQLAEELPLYGPLIASHLVLLHPRQPSSDRPHDPVRSPQPATTTCMDGEPLPAQVRQENTYTFLDIMVNSVEDPTRNQLFYSLASVQGNHEPVPSTPPATLSRALSKDILVSPIGNS